MPIEKTGNFITLSAGGDSLKIPFAAYESGKQTISTVVDQARTADGIVRGSVIARANKIELKWAVLTPETWSKICKFFDKHFTIWLRTALRQRKCMSAIDQRNRSKWIQ